MTDAPGGPPDGPRSAAAASEDPEPRDTPAEPQGTEDGAPVGELESNPLRSEADAFRLLTVVMGAAALVILTAVVLGSGAGAVLLVCFLLVAAYRSAVWLREGMRSP